MFCPLFLKKMLKNKLFIFFTAILFLFFPSPSFGEVIRSFDVDITASKNGNMQITEKINYDFEEAQRHGIFRKIPTYSKVGDFYRVIEFADVTVKRDGNYEKFHTEGSAEEISFKIGDPNRTISGAHRYEISYIVKNGVGSNFPTHDEIYWNATGNSWQIPIESASIKIGTDFSAETKELICYTGGFGSTDKNCSIQNNTVKTTSSLSANEGLTAVAVFPVNTFPKSVLTKTKPGNLSTQTIILLGIFAGIVFVLLNFVLAPYLLYWYRQNKNKKKYGPPSVNFDFPKDKNGQRIAPALSGIMDNAKLDRDDVMATIFDLAIRKYIKIEEQNEQKTFGVIGSGKKQIIRKLKEADSTFNSYEKTLFNRLFKEGNSVEISDLKKDFYKTFSEMEKNAFDILVKNNYYTKNPKIQKGLLLMAGIFSFFLFSFILGSVLIYLSIKLNGRTEKGDEMDFKIDGLKLFLKSMGRNYKWQAERFYVVEQMIPYAMALGFIDEFMKQLKLIKPDYSPTWYSGYHGGFYSGVNSLNSSMTTNMTTSSSSGRSGGFSGGGGGGGGGGSW